MKQIIILIFLLISPFLNASPNNLTASNIVVGYGQTQSEAYSDARSKIYAGYVEARANYHKAPHQWVCILSCKKLKSLLTKAQI